MEIEVGRKGNISLVKVSGVVDSETVDEFSSALNGLLDRGEFRIVLDIEKLSYINTAGLSVIADVFKKARQGQGSLRLLNASDSIRELLEIVRFTRIIDLYDDEQKALDSFKKEGTSSA